MQMSMLGRSGHASGAAATLSSSGLARLRAGTEVPCMIFAIEHKQGRNNSNLKKFRRY